MTRAIAARGHVQTMRRDAYGELVDNSFPARVSLGPTAPSTPWLVEFTDADGLFWLACFDFDAKDSTGPSTELAERAADDAQDLSTLLTRLGMPHVVCQSSRTGGRHIWLAVDGAPVDVMRAIAAAGAANYSTLDHGMLANARTGGARPPLSPHRDGSWSTILHGDPCSLTERRATLADLQGLLDALVGQAPALRESQSPSRGPVDTTHRAHRDLSPAGAGHMATIGGGSNPSWTGWMCVLSAAAAGWSFADVQRAADTAPGMEHYRTKNTGRGGRRPRSPQEAHKRLERQWARAVQRVALERPLPASSGPQDLTGLELLVDDVETLLHRFRVSPGRWGATEAAVSDRTILTALAYLTLQTGKRTVAASIRDLALMAGLGRTTAATALQRLATAGFVRRATAATDGNAAEWRLTPHLSTTLSTVRTQLFSNPRPPAALFARRAALVRQLEYELADVRHDLFTRAGLGHLAGRAYALLGQVAQVTVETAAGLLGSSKRHVVKILSRLRTHKLIVRAREGWRRSRQDLRDKAARKLDVAGVLEHRAIRYEWERELWEWWLQELHHMTAQPQTRKRRSHPTARPLEFHSAPRGERTWPRYPRTGGGVADHRAAREYVIHDILEPESLFSAGAWAHLERYTPEAWHQVA